MHAVDGTIITAEWKQHHSILASAISSTLFLFISGRTKGVAVVSSSLPTVFPRSMGIEPKVIGLIAQTKGQINYWPIRGLTQGGCRANLWPDCWLDYKQLADYDNERITFHVGQQSTLCVCVFVCIHTHTHICVCVYIYTVFTMCVCLSVYTCNSLIIQFPSSSICKGSARHS